jgi:hypothetical protein
MFTFKQFLKETPAVMHADDYDQASNRLQPPEIKNNHLSNKKETSEYKKLSDLKGHEVWGSHKEGIYHLVDPKTKETHIELTGMSNGNDFYEELLAGTGKTNIKAHTFYHHLITKHGVVLHSSDTHSIGGFKTWKKLSEYPDVKLSHVDNNNRPLKFSPNLDSNYGYNHTNTHFIATKRKPK